MQTEGYSSKKILGKETASRNLKKMLKVAAVQILNLNSTSTSDRDANLERAKKLIEENKGARYLNHFVFHLSQNICFALIIDLWI